MPSRIWWVGIVIGLVVASHLAWKDERDRAIAAEGDSVSRNDAHWNRAIETFQGMWNLDIEAVLTKTIKDGVNSEEWNLFLHHGSGDYAAHLRACETACKLAGHALSVSALWANLPSEVTEKTTPLDRWLRFVAFKDGFDGTTGTGYDNTGPERIDTESIGISEVNKKSKRLCEDCRSNALIASAR